VLKSKKTLIIAIVAGLVLFGSTAGVVLAQTGSTNPDPTKTLLGRVATILKIDQKTLENAFTQARTDMQEERLQNLVKEGKITQAQLDQYKQWLKSRPDTKPYQDQLKNWQQTRPPVPPNVKQWQESRPNVPLPGFGGRFGGGFGGKF